MTFEEKQAIAKSKENQVWKRNDIVQKSKFSLSVTEQKTINFLVSLIKPKEEYLNQVQPLEYEFEIQDYCKICDINYESGKNYKTVRDTLRELCRKDSIVTLPNGTETRVTWVNKFWSNKGEGWAKIRFDDDMAPYLFDLHKNTTRFQLLNILPMQSKYSIRLYEICKSWAGIHLKQYSLEELRVMLGLSEFELARYPDFRRKVLEIAQREINEYTDLNVDFEPVTRGRKTISIKIHIKEKKVVDFDNLEGQLDIYDYLEYLPGEEIKNGNNI